LRYESLDRPQRCGSCQQALPSPAEPIDLASERVWSPLIEQSALPVLVDFWAAWCGPCQMMAPELKKVAQSLAGRVIVAKVNTEELPELARAHRIASLPTLSLFWKGRELDRIMGARPAQAIRQWLEQVFASANRN
jgi:thioredoxin 2